MRQHCPCLTKEHLTFRIPVPWWTHVIVLAGSHMSGSSCWSVLSSDSWKQHLPAGVRLRLTGLCRGEEVGKTPECKRLCVFLWADWHKQGQQAEECCSRNSSPNTDNHQQKFVVFFSTHRDNLHFQPLNHPSLRLYSWIRLRANHLSSQISYRWAELKEMTFCWITFLLINDSVRVNNLGKLKDGRILYPSWWRLMNDPMHHSVKRSIQRFVK